MAEQYINHNFSEQCPIEDCSNVLMQFNCEGFTNMTNAPELLDWTRIDSYRIIKGE